MPAFVLLVFFALLGFPAVQAGLNRLPPKIYGVNLGSWLLVEPWMLRQEWINMGGQLCDADCTKCAASEYAFAKKFPNTVDAIFERHWDTWFNQADVDELKSLGINAVRIPLGYWIVETLIEGDENFPRGVLRALRRGLRQLDEAGIVVVLDHHALPGAAASNQMFAGRCTFDPQFYTPHNYDRALIWTSVMTILSHLDPVFAPVVAIQAINEQLQDPNKTPGFGEFMQNFVQVVRATELALGLPDNAADHTSQRVALGSSTNIIANLEALAASNRFNARVRAALRDTIPALSQLVSKYDLDFVSYRPPMALPDREPLITNFMDILWQGSSGANPADAAMGPQAYDDHLYYSFGGVAQYHTPDSYMHHLCNLNRIEKDVAAGNVPLWFGEWSLATHFTATDAWLKKWADAQKLQYSKGAGWFFWNFKIEISAMEGDTARQWSYVEGVRRGYLTKDPSAYHDPKVCDEWIGKPPPGNPANN